MDMKYIKRLFSPSTLWFLRSRENTFAKERILRCSWGKSAATSPSRFPPKRVPTQCENCTTKSAMQIGTIANATWVQRSPVLHGFPRAAVVIILSSHQIEAARRRRTPRENRNKRKKKKKRKKPRHALARGRKGEEHEASTRRELRLPFYLLLVAASHPLARTTRRRKRAISSPGSCSPPRSCVSS